MSLSDDELFNIWVLLRRSIHAMLKARNNELRQYGVSSVEAATMNIIYTMGNRATSIKISRLLLRESHSVTTLIQRMEKKGLIKRDSDSHKGRQIFLELTDKGNELYQKSWRLMVIRTILESLSDEDCRQLGCFAKTLGNTALRKLANNTKSSFSLLE